MRSGGGPSRLFDRTRRRLTLQYGGVLTVFLALFVVVVYAALYWFIWNDQRSRLEELADSETDILQTWAAQDNNPNRPPPREVEDAFSVSSDQSFYYYIAENGDLWLGDEIQPGLRAQVMERIDAGQFRERRMENVALQMTSEPIPNGQAGVSAGGDAVFLVTDRDVLWEGERIGKLYVGKDVTFQHNLFNYLLILLVGTALLFFVLAFWLSRYMSRKAIVPVARAYERQREFAADASHELRTPLSVLLASIETLELEAGEEHGSFARGVLDGMKEEARSMKRLTEELLLLARSDSADAALHCAPFDAKGTLLSVADKLRPVARDKGVALATHVPTELSVDWDEEKLARLLVLLIDNAIKYTPEGGAVDVTLAVAEDRGGRALALEVKDNGIGISSEALPRIFDRFYRQDKARARQAGGYGLGLAIAKQIADMSGGTIRADSREGEGSTFTVRIPLRARRKSW